jgi:hypothetical protein
MTEPRLSAALDANVPEMRWDGDVIVVDRRAFGEDEKYLRIEPNERGLYVVMGGIWRWEEVPVDDEHPVRAFPGAHPAFRERVRPGRPRRGLDHSMPAPANTAAEGRAKHHPAGASSW